MVVTANSPKQSSRKRGFYEDQVRGHHDQSEFDHPHRQADSKVHENRSADDQRS